MAELIHVKSVQKPVFETYVSAEYLERFPGEYKPITGDESVTPIGEIPAEAQAAAFESGSPNFYTSEPQN